MEIILFSYKINNMNFPYILHLFELKAFDFCKIIESVVKHESDVIISKKLINFIISLVSSNNCKTFK